MKAVIYARYSSDNQRKESIEGQVRECKAFAECKGYAVINTYADRAISGKKADNRPQFMQMIADSRQGLKTNHGKTPTYSFIINILKNRRYLGEYRFQDIVVENAFTPLVEPEIFNKCQRRLAENQLRPASFKPVEDKYILTGKIFCGYCGGTMSGVSATSSTGATHRYYHCHAAKKHKTCVKKRISKRFVETVVTDMALKMFDDLPLLNQIVDNCYELQLREGANLPALERQLAQAQTEIDNVMNAIKQGIITPTTKSTLEELEQEKANLDIAIAKEHIERPILSKDQIKYWLCKYSGTDPDDMAQKQQLIDVFVNSIYVYDDKMVVTFNYKDGDKWV